MQTSLLKNVVLIVAGVFLFAIGILVGMQISVPTAPGPVSDTSVRPQAPPIPPTSLQAQVTAYDKVALKPILPGEEQIILNLSQGWNLIGLGSRGGRLNNVSSCRISQLYAYNPGFRSWENPRYLQPYKGYFIYSWDSGCQVQVADPFSSQDSQVLLQPGWNIISADASWNDIAGDCQINGRQALYRFDVASQQYRQVELSQNLDSSSQHTGYFVKIKDACKLDVETTAPQPSPQVKRCRYDSDCPSGLECKGIGPIDPAQTGLGYCLPPDVQTQ